jgi:hypothetical protein
MTGSRIILVNSGKAMAAGCYIPQQLYIARALLVLLVLQIRFPASTDVRLACMLTSYDRICSQSKVVFSRAYINFKLSEDLFDFKDKFHGHVFVSNKGNQYVCNVEYAPNQKVPKPVAKKDPRDGTIERGRLWSMPILPGV